MFLSINTFITRMALVDDDDDSKRNKIIKVCLGNSFSSLAIKIRFTEI